ncbi:uncharacterized protein F4812DRAFT_468514 [Daldinia caldariorum]|uniref:uncharacterized protein n=1 Tax=Daldinia caldariorum TaxID=326644 RepID=UPI0020082A4B|nr:uncharacterized protein F4812DRAFT_468514 [Daldinia caldariorum]KAI1463618.1 hypothetical protein F4812DRAFT_468514 [Daldinia caldariorum]
MIIQTVSLRDPNKNYLSCKASDGSLRFDLVDLDPSCKFFMVPMGRGRTCLKGPNGRFVDIHGNRFRCDGITTGVGFIFSDNTLQLDRGKYLSNVVDNNTITARDTATSLVIKSTSFESFSVSTSLSVPTITYDDVFVECRYRPGRDYLALKKSSGTINITFSIPYSMYGEGNGTVEVILNHMRDNVAGGVIDIGSNNQPLIQKYAPPTKFEAQNLSSLSLYPLSGENTLSITLSQGFLGTYCFSDAALVFKDNNGYLRQENSVREPGTSIDIFLNGSNIEDRYDKIPTDSFGISTFPIHSDRLKKSNELVIKPNDGKYYISDVNLDVVSLLPNVTEENFKTYIKNWILHQRRNIGELSKIPRGDLSAWKFVKEAPYWFFIPFLPVSPEEISVLFDYYNMMFVSVAFEIRNLNNKARDFHKELISTDLPRKNALRHAYWTAMLSRRFGLFFALELSTAHEEAHVDLTIEGPFDHVTDKINNAVGSLLGSRTPRSKNLQDVIDAAWANGELAYAKDFRETSGGQTAKKYNVKPRFSPSEKDTLKMMRVTEPDVPIIY